ncbi:MAG TPA: ribulose-phosphate 3-epimerase [Planctomycetota bacterium]|nr:ribulose-phosphate 3-epimerase [Planctomycetota bacterium]HRR79113.1 ribulose-phosphate 3-epimerase [Planctomycetota bacterium]HRT93154.1 ribulose-phosphate 3-epimerase [Planctomycetota bacterium]
MRVKIAPSLLAADWLRLGDEVASVIAAGADLLHCDVMDGHYVPNLTMGVPIVAAVAGVSSVPLDVHLMLDNPGAFVEIFARAGAATIGFHVEVAPKPGDLIAAIRACGKRASITLSPPTPAAAVEPFLDAVDQVLVMSVAPGFGGQEFIPAVLDKVRRLRRLAPPGLDIEIDGGINPATAAAAVAAGANVLVAGTAIFGASDRAHAIRTLRG